MKRLRTPLGRLRVVAIAEGVSFLLLLFVAMPLKYLWDLPLAVRVTGMAHGLLFLAFGVALLIAALDRRWGWGRLFLVFLSSLIPFGTFIMDKSLKQEESTLGQNS